MSKARVVLLCVALLAPMFQPSGEARALDRDVRTVLIVGLYGVAAGSLLGALAFPATQDVKAIFIGSSVGLYLGFIVGIYHVNHRDDPQNPLASLGGPRGVQPKDIQSELKLAYSYPVVRF